MLSAPRESFESGIGGFVFCDTGLKCATANLLSCIANMMDRFEGCFSTSMPCNARLMVFFAGFERCFCASKPCFGASKRFFSANQTMDSAFEGFGAEKKVCVGALQACCAAHKGFDAVKQVSRLLSEAVGVSPHPGLPSRAGEGASLLPSDLRHWRCAPQAAEMTSPFTGDMP